jgi:hypothetical protein
MEMRRITAGYLSAMQVPLMKGRDLSDRDGPGQPPVAIVNETFAKKFFRGGDAIGHRLRMSPRTPWITIIGVTGDVRNMGLEASPPAQVYSSLWQTGTDGAVKETARTSASGRALRHKGEPVAKRRERRVNENSPYWTRTLPGSISAQRRFMWLFLPTGMRNLSGGSEVSVAICGRWRIGLHTVAFESVAMESTASIGSRWSSYWKNAGSRCIWSMLTT